MSDGYSAIATRHRQFISTAAGKKWRVATETFRMKRFRLCLATFAVIAAAILIYDSSSIAWVGHTDLEIAFHVVDAETGQPIEGAAIDVKQDAGGFCEDASAREFELLTDQNGQALHLSRSCMCFGTQSRLKFKDTFSVHLPWWHFRVSADGHETSKAQDLDVPEHIRRAKWVAPGFARLAVQVELARSAASVD